MSTLDQMLFAEVRTRLNAASAITSAKALVGRDDATDSLLPKPPAILYSPISTAGQIIIDATFDLTVVEKRGRALGSGGNPVAAGPMDNIEDAVANQMIGWTPTLTGWSAGAVSLRYMYRTTFENPETITWRRKYGFTAVRGGSKAVLSGSEGSLTVAGLNGVVEFWQINSRRPLKTIATEIRDRTPRYTTGDPMTTGSMRVRLAKDGVNIPLPVTGTIALATFQTSPGVTWQDTMLFHSVTWLTGPDEPIQLVSIEFAITNESSPFHPVPNA